MALRNLWTLEKCQHEALKYETRSAWQKGSNSSYNAAYRNQWVDQCSKHMISVKVLRGHWTKEHCIKEALNYATRSEWYKKSNGSWDAAYRNKWLEECCAHMVSVQRPKGYWTLEKCKEEASTYKSRYQWKEQGHGYEAAFKNGWLDECKSRSTTVKPNNYWTLEKCKEEALKHKTKMEWHRDGKGADVAQKNGWYRECCSHMKDLGSTSLPEQDLFSVIKNLYPKAQTLRVRTKNHFPDKPHIHGFDIDIYIPELRKGIEFNGTYYHSLEGLRRGRPAWPDEDLINYHQIKKTFFNDRGISYIEVADTEWNETRNDCLQRIYAFLDTKTS